MNRCLPVVCSGSCRLLAVVLFMLIAGGQGARAGDRVADYFAGLESFQATFTQTVVDSGGEQLQRSEGSVWIERPGRFRWDYRTPYRQLIVADGERLWTYDEDLEQATVQRIDEALSSTPAMLLSGFRPLSEVMSWSAAEGDDPRLDWFRLEPRRADAAVEKIRIGFDGDQLAIIDVVDGLGNSTRIRFSAIVRNEPVDDSLFRLRLPEDTDIIGDVDD